MSIIFWMKQKRKNNPILAKKYGLKGGGSYGTNEL
jgi:hypothetical protein